MAELNQNCPLAYHGTNFENWTLDLCVLFRFLLAGIEEQDEVRRSSNVLRRTQLTQLSHSSIPKFADRKLMKLT